MSFTYAPTGDTNADTFLTNCAAHLETLPVADRAKWLSAKADEVARWKLAVGMSIICKANVMAQLCQWEAQADAAAAQVAA